ncbi:hypothetical protein FRX31_003554 [Thalictrum thalictroides]|uniref:Uncharacterized protein n=1 Tax=Thalictrum thalictroides TaxID=46969 RepID=A0A7J6XB46_THATH|nr:hypothetical protein FRX31_003554 [Thalictrum thalictroides]
MIRGWSMIEVENGFIHLPVGRKPGLMQTKKRPYTIVGSGAQLRTKAINIEGGSSMRTSHQGRR